MGMVKREKTAVVGLTLRLREDLRRWLAKSAEEEGRSLNGEVICRLEESLRQENLRNRLDRLQDLTQTLSESHERDKAMREEVLHVANRLDRRFSDVDQFVQDRRHTHPESYEPSDKIIEAARLLRNQLDRIESDNSEFIQHLSQTLSKSHERDKKLREEVLSILRLNQKKS
jgi:hypothetical protein